MSHIIELETKRLKLRQWKDQDYLPFAKLNADPNVMEFFPSVLTNIESDALANKMKTLIAEKGWGFWAVEEKSTGLFVGTLGLHEPTDPLPFTPCVEIGWRFLHEYWGKGYAVEAGKEVLKFAFDVLELEELVSFTSVKNKRSYLLMERLGMKNSNENFEHEALPKRHKLREHLLYKLNKNDFYA